MLEPYCGARSWDHAGKRVVDGQLAMQAAGDMFLGWATSTGKIKRQYCFRQLSDAKIKPVVELIKLVNLKNYADLGSGVLTRAYSRTTDPIVLTGYLGKIAAFKDALADFGVAYADQNERDYSTLLSVIRSGRIEAHMAVYGLVFFLPFIMGLLEIIRGQ